MSTSNSTPAGSVPREAVHWLWRDRIPGGMISLVAGRPGTGKSMFAVLVAADLTRKRRNVIFVAGEDPVKQVVRPRLEAAGADLDRVHLLPHLTLPEDLGRLEAEIVKHKVTLVVVDPVAAHLGVSIYNDQEVRRALTPLAALAEDRHCGIMLISHVVKSFAKSSHPMQAIGGSGGGLVGASRMVYILGANPGNADERLLGFAKSNLLTEPKTLAFEIDVEDFAEGEVPFLVFQGDSDVDTAALLNAGQPTAAGRPPDKLEEAAAWLVAHLFDKHLLDNGSPALAKDVKEDATQHGITAATLRRAADEIGIVKPKGGPNSTWQLPAALLQQLLAAQDNEDGDGDE